MCLESAHLTSDLIDILQRQAEGLVRRPRRGLYGIQGLKEGGPGGTTLLACDLPALKPGHLQEGTETGQGHAAVSANAA